MTFVIELPQFPQRQDSLQDQLRDVIRYANGLGCYDAADWIKDRIAEQDKMMREYLPVKS